MTKLEEISVLKSTSTRISKELVEQNEFGAVISDHMFIADFYDGDWHNARVMPYSDLTLNPATLALHYGQSVFEGMKAFKGSKNELRLFRPEKNLD